MPKPKIPTAIKKQLGNPTKENTQKWDRELQPEGKLVMPFGMPERAETCWKMIAPYLEARKLVGSTDRFALELACRAYARAVECFKDMDASGITQTNDTGTISPTPAARLASVYAEQWRKFANEYGLTAAARSKVMVPEDGENADLEALLNVKE